MESNSFTAFKKHFSTNQITGELRTENICAHKHLRCNNL